MTFKYKYIFLAISLLLLFPVVSALNVDIDTPTNYSTISTNYSTYSGDAHLFDGYSPSTLYSYYKSMFDSVYATISSLANYLPLTGGTLTGNLTADYFIGNGSLLTGIESGLWESSGGNTQLISSEPTLLVDDLILNTTNIAITNADNSTRITFDSNGTQWVEYT